MLKEEDIDFILSKYKKNAHEISEEIKDEISEKEAIQIYNELLEVLIKHNVSYKCGCNITVSLMYAFITGAAELYEEEMNS